jgi:hypothetical protein
MRHAPQDRWPQTEYEDALDRQRPRETVTATDIIKILCAILLPPLGVFWRWD